MEYRHLGRSGLIVSVLGLGTNAFGGRADKSTSIRIIHTALDQGVTLIDTANVYCAGESEKITGEALRGRRSGAVLATKAGLPVAVGPYGQGASRRHLIEQLEKSLTALNTDYLDLFYVHTFDPTTPLEETLRTLDDMVQSGKVRYVAASNYFAWELMKALHVSELRGLVRFAGIQTSYSLADRTPEAELLPLCHDQGVGLVAYYPIAGGILSGKYLKGEVPAGSRADRDRRFAARLQKSYLALAEQVSDIAMRHGATPAALSLQWLTQRPGVSSAIVGVTSVTQALDNMRAVNTPVRQDGMQELDQVSEAFITGEKFGWYRLQNQAAPD